MFDNFKEILRKFKKFSNFLLTLRTFWINKKFNCALKKLLKFKISLNIRILLK